MELLHGLRNCWNWNYNSRLCHFRFVNPVFSFTIYTGCIFSFSLRNQVYKFVNAVFLDQHNCQRRLVANKNLNTRTSINIAHMAPYCKVVCRNVNNIICEICIGHLENYCNMEVSAALKIYRYY